MRVRGWGLSVGGHAWVENSAVRGRIICEFLSHLSVVSFDLCVVHRGVLFLPLVSIPFPLPPSYWRVLFALHASSVR